MIRILTLIVISLFIFQINTFASIAVDATSESAAQDEISAAFNWNHTDTGSDVVVLVFVHWVEFSSGDRGVASVTFDGNSLTSIYDGDSGTENSGNINSGGGGSQAGIWAGYYIIGTGSELAKAIVVTPRGAPGNNNAMGAFAITFSGADQSSPIGATSFTIDISAGDGILSDSITTTRNNSYVLSMASNKGVASGITPDSSQTEPAGWDYGTGGTTSDGSMTGGYIQKVTAGLQAMQWSSMTTDDQIVAAFEIKEAIAAGARRIIFVQ